MSATGKNTTSASTPSFVAALITGIVIGSVYLTLFYVLHSRDRKTFQPKSYLGPPEKRVRELPVNPIGWFRGIWTEPDATVAQVNGLDAYFFIRFIKAMILLLLPCWLLTWVIIFPVSATSPSNNLKGLDMFTLGNVAVEIRLVAHLLVAIALIFWTLFILYREFMHWTRVRLGYLASATYAAYPRSRSVMITNLPKGAETDDGVRKLSSFVAAPENVWLVHKVKPLEKLLAERQKEVYRLEGAVTKVQSLAAKNVRKNQVPNQQDPDLISRYITDKKRPSHRMGPLGLIGKKQDTLDDTPHLIRERNDDLARERARLTTFPLANTAFARFPTGYDAHAFASGLRAHSGSRTLAVHTDIVADDVIWANLSMSPAMRFIRVTISWALTIGLIIIWAPLVLFVGVISNINKVCSTVSFLNWICKLPRAVVGIIQGILPPVLLAVLFMLLPMFLRTCIKLQGEPLHSTVERKLWNRFWLFQIIHGFLIVAIGSGVIGSLTDVAKSASQLPTQLATQLPSSSIFFLTFILTATLGGATKTFSRAVPFIMRKLAFILRGNAPRKAYKYDYGMSSTALATTWPPVALLGVMAVVYMVVQPIIVGFACCGFILLYLTYKYMLTWVCDQPTHLETNGFYYPYALGAIFAGLYIEEIFLAALYFLRRTTAGYICGGFIAAMVVVTVVFQIWIDRRSRRIATFLTKESVPKSDSSEHLNVHPPAHRDGDTQIEERVGFQHPAVWKDQPVVWIADDVLGIGNSLRGKIEEVGVATSTQGATMGEDGKTVVVRGPPDEPWYGDDSVAPGAAGHAQAPTAASTIAPSTHAPIHAKMGTTATTKEHV